MKLLYKIDDHPLDVKLVVRKFEIVRSTPKYFFIAPVITPSRARKFVPTKIRRSQKDYFASTNEARAAYIKRREEIIKRSQQSIRAAEEDLKLLKRDIKDE